MSMAVIILFIYLPVVSSPFGKGCGYFGLLYTTTINKNDSLLEPIVFHDVMCYKRL